MESNYLHAFEMDSPQKDDFAKTKKFGVKNTLEEHNEIGLLTKKVEVLESKVLEKNSMFGLLLDFLFQQLFS